MAAKSALLESRLQSHPASQKIGRSLIKIVQSTLPMTQHRYSLTFSMAAFTRGFMDQHPPGCIALVACQDL